MSKPLWTNESNECFLESNYRSLAEEVSVDLSNDVAGGTWSQSILAEQSADHVSGQHR